MVRIRLDRGSEQTLSSGLEAMMGTGDLWRFIITSKRSHDTGCTADPESESGKRVTRKLIS